MVKTQKAAEHNRQRQRCPGCTPETSVQTQTDGNTLRWMQAHEQRPTDESGI
jgi:hypothetical protein